jgi:hypothetical protein
MDPVHISTSLGIPEEFSEMKTKRKQGLVQPISVFFSLISLDQSYNGGLLIPQSIWSLRSNETKPQFSFDNPGESIHRLFSDLVVPAHEGAIEARENPV